MLKTAKNDRFAIQATEIWRGTAVALALGFLLSIVGCKTNSSSQAGNFDNGAAGTKGLTAEEQKAVAAATLNTNKDAKVTASDSQVLREADTLRITFPGAPNLNSVQPIRRDGKISLPLIGEVQAAGKTPSALGKELVDLYGPQLQVKEVDVTLESSAFPVYVTGAVLRPGKILSDRPLKLLEAVMEAGGFDYARANTKSVRIIRGGEHFQVNLRQVLDGKRADNFDLKPSDIIYVPERFAWF